MNTACTVEMIQEGGVASMGGSNAVQNHIGNKAQRRQKHAHSKAAHKTRIRRKKAENNAP